jgi:hypothetical protein
MEETQEIANEDKKNYTGRITEVMLNTQEGRKL